MSRFSLGSSCPDEQAQPRSENAQRGLFLFQEKVSLNIGLSMRNVVKPGFDLLKVQKLVNFDMALKKIRLFLYKQEDDVTQHNNGTKKHAFLTCTEQGASWALQPRLNTKLEGPHLTFNPQHVFIDCLLSRWRITISSGSRKVSGRQNATGGPPLCTSRTRRNNHHPGTNKSPLRPSSSSAAKEEYDFADMM